MDVKQQPTWDVGWTSLLACPACGEPLAGDESSGLRCARCARLFPVRAGVPTLLLDPSSAELKTQELYDDIWDKHKPSPSQGGYRAPATSNIELLKLASDSELVQGTAGIDAGCGNGAGTLALASRHAGIRFIGIDLADSIRRAASPTNILPNLRYVQGNLMEPPLARQAFDFAYSFGVLHHTRDPHAAFVSLLERLRPGGRITLFVYKDFSDIPLKKMLLAPVRLLRKASTRLPAPWLRRMTLGAAPLVFITLTAPARLLRAMHLARLARHIPYGTFPSIRGIAASLEDRFGVPYEHRFSLADLRSWAQRARLENVRVVDCLPWGFSGLVLSGQTPGPAK